MTKRTRRLVGLLFGAACIALFAWGLRAYLGRPKLNVLIVTLDTTRADRIGCYGYSNALTPTIDELASSGVLFEKAYASAPLTLPSHATIMTGLYPPEHGLHANGQNRLGTGIPTLAEILAQRGYETGAFIAAFVLNAKFGLARGFKTYDDGLSDDEQLGDELHRNRAGDQVVDSALLWLKRHDDRPFFCWVHLYDPHFSYLPHEETFGERFQDQPYDAEIAFVDLQLKRLVDYLKNRSLETRTLVIVVGDHGEGLGDHGERTHAYMLYNSTQHVPLVVSMPDSGMPARRVPEPVSLTDLFPSILDCLGISHSQPVSGRSLKPALDGKAIAPGICYAETDQPYLAARCSPLQSVTTAQWKYIRTTRAELYDLQCDPTELENLAPTQPEQVQVLEDLLVDMEQRMGRRDSPQAPLSVAEERALASLGYVGGQAAPAAIKAKEKLPDTKDMLPYFNLCDDALKAMSYRNYPQAEEILRPVVEAVPTYFEARSSLGICLFKQQRYDEAGAEFQRALELGATPVTVNLALGLTRMEQGRFDEARLHFSEALRIESDSAEVHYHLGTALWKLGQFQEARDEFKKAIHIKPDYMAARTALRAIAGLEEQGSP